MSSSSSAKFEAVQLTNTCLSRFNYQYTIQSFEELCAPKKMASILISILSQLLEKNNMNNNNNKNTTTVERMESLIKKLGHKLGVQLHYINAQHIIQGKTVDILYIIHFIFTDLPFVIIIILPF